MKNSRIYENFKIFSKNFQNVLESLVPESSRTTHCLTCVQNADQLRRVRAIVHKIEAIELAFLPRFGLISTQQVHKFPNSLRFFGILWGIQIKGQALLTVPSHCDFGFRLRGGFVLEGGSELLLNQFLKNINFLKFLFILNISNLIFSIFLSLPAIFPYAPVLVPFVGSLRRRLWRHRFFPPFSFFDEFFVLFLNSGIIWNSLTISKMVTFLKTNLKN